MQTVLKKIDGYQDFPFEELLKPVGMKNGSYSSKEYMEKPSMPECSDELEPLYDMNDWRNTRHYVNAQSSDPLEACIARTVIQVKIDLSRVSEAGEEMFGADGLLLECQMLNYVRGYNAWNLFVQCADGEDCNPLERCAVESIAWQYMYRATKRIPQDLLKKLYARFKLEGFEYGLPTVDTKLHHMVAEPLMDYLRAIAFNEKEY